MPSDSELKKMLVLSRKFLAPGGWAQGLVVLQPGLIAATQSR